MTKTICDSVNHTRLPKEFSYQTEHVGTNNVKRVIVYSIHGSSHTCSRKYSIFG